MGLEAHLASIHQIIKRVNPKVVVLDPITNFIYVVRERRGEVDAHAAGGLPEDEADHRHVHPSFHPWGRLESTDEAISSIMDSWLLLRDVEHEGRRSCALYVLKSRGMAHSHEMREFLLTDDGIRLGGIYTEEFNSAR